MAFFLCNDCPDPYYARGWREVEEHEASTGHSFVDDSPDWTS